MKIMILTTGGTIAGQVAGTANPTAEVVQTGLAEILRPLCTELEADWGVTVEIESDEVANVDSSNINPGHWIQLVEKIEAHYDDHDGFVITHGTNTMGYTTAALALALPNLGKGVAVTGSQVPFGAPGSDAIMNLENAVRVIAYPYESLRGVMCVFGSQLITGARAQKISDFDYDAFESFHSPQLAHIGRIFHLDREAIDAHRDYLDKRFARARNRDKLETMANFDPRILSLNEYPGLSAELLIDLTKEGLRGANPRIGGVIFRAFGAGDPSEGLYPWFEMLKEREIPVVVATQAPRGISNFDVNESGKYLYENKLAIPSHDMCLEAITAKLSWLIGRGTPYTSMLAEMHTNYAGEINIVLEHK